MEDKVNDQYSLVKELKTQSTWKLFLFTILTLGIYYVHYIKKQSIIINKYMDNKNKISDIGVRMLMGFTYFNVILVLINSFSFTHANAIILDYISWILFIMIIIWGYTAKNRLNEYSKLDKSSAYWFHGLWTFLFTPFYFNYNINCFYQKVLNLENEDKLNKEKRVS